MRSTWLFLWRVAMDAVPRPTGLYKRLIDSLSAL